MCVYSISSVPLENLNKQLLINNQLVKLKTIPTASPQQCASVSCRIWEAETGGSLQHREFKSCLGNTARVKQNMYLEKLLYRHKN